jgi:hypothetical protein
VHWATAESALKNVKHLLWRPPPIPAVFPQKTRNNRRLRTLTKFINLEIYQSRNLAVPRLTVLKFGLTEQTFCIIFSVCVS